MTNQELKEVLRLKQENLALNHRIVTMEIAEIDRKIAAEQDKQPQDESEQAE